jgi:two-component system response regulator (stage 0 sporulation protein F)
MPGKTYDILVVDDKAGVRRLIYEALLDDGYLVEQASNGAEAIRKVKQKKYGVILLDVKMPGMNGLETLNEIRKIDRNVPVVMMTAYGELEIMEEAHNKGVKYQISKPFDLNELRALVKGILETGLRESALQLG